MSYCPPRRAALLAALTLFSSSVFAQSYTEDPINQKLEQLAVTLAASLKDPNVRQLVKAEVGKKFDGDYNALYSSMANQSLGGELTFRQELVRSSSSFSGDSRSAAKSLDHLALEFPRLQIAVPANYEKWDARKTVPLVAYIPQGVDIDSLDEIKAFDANGKLHLLSTVEAPDFPVVVLGMNERTNELGYLEKGYLPTTKKAAADDATRLIELELPPPEGEEGGGGTTSGGGSSCTTKPHNHGDQEWLRQITIYNDHEGWFQGYPDIFLTVAYIDPYWPICHPTFEPCGQLVEKTFDLNEVNAEGQPYYRADQLLYWNTSVSRSLFIHVREADGGNWVNIPVNIDGVAATLTNSFKSEDASLGYTYVNFADSNCKVHYLPEAQFILDYTP